MASNTSSMTSTSSTSSTISITHELIRSHASPESMRRGQDYYVGARVGSLSLRDDILTATVRGSDVAPYTVRATIRDGSFASVSCSCPYDWGDWCKHIVAVALALEERGGSVEVRPSLRSRLDSLDRDALVNLVSRLAESSETTEAAIERLLTMVEMTSVDVEAQPSPPVEVDTESIKRRVHSAVHSLDRMRRSEAYWHIGGVAREVTTELDTARVAIEQNQGRLALAIIRAVMESYIDHWTWLDDSDGEASSVFWEIGKLLAEGLLDPDLSPAVRSDWVDRIDEWMALLSDYGVDDPLIDASVAARHGWDWQSLAPPNAGDWSVDDEIEDEWESADLEAMRTRVLARTGRTDEALQFAARTGQVAMYVTILANAGDIDGATTWAIEHLRQADDAFIVAKELDRLGSRHHALRVAEHGLKLPAAARSSWYVEGEPGAYSPIHHRLGTWLTEQAEAADEVAIARRAAMAALTASPTLSGWLTASRLHDDWPDRREKLLNALRSGAAQNTAGRVDIFLHEGLIGDAIATVSRQHAYADYGLLARVAQAAIETHPEWVITTSKQQAEEIMNRGASAHYDAAAQWLGRARAASVASGKTREWQEYLGQIMTTHQRKYKLMPLLRPLTIV